MVWFNSRSSTSESSHVRKRSPSRRSTSGYSTHHSRHSAPSIFSFSGSRTGRSSPSVFSSASSSRRARPRSGFIQRVIRYIRRLFRDISSYARRHPFKVLMLVVLPLITSGVLYKLFAMIGIHLPKHIFGGSAASSARSAGQEGMAGNIKGLMNIAKMFM
ncbi:hypothetical protein P175DRAFT_0510522 [Aspergillus ochraceoroseus IBT 24754]|uniref:Uncharacterized protein n=3 Tax=Aspergillus subgen. Nidulantes TaxID=2720870 RepID=A0A0F8XNP6_9EURO|nr:uncharacterized protein P175DRAFT_0510522 [Aspergillus ochraceoroseus IBT 24754]KKK24765.1 hypothetical protein AOCH_002218 [Aspergillus ochraceoroseus]KKK25122.1 hypothetical protein ARAM_003479 [Aspergillus rambellii]PTU19236.1 hypothetical protein P175DRAFT_0510522 [Aspergillus ochraceoroseus IBT 24754]